MYDSANELYFVVRVPGNKSTRDRLLIRLLESPGITVSASGVSKTIFLSSDSNKLCHDSKLLIQETKADNKSD